MTPLRRYIAGKLHGLTVTGKALHYSGSVSISVDLMDGAGIQPYEEVQIVNLANGARWTTYALPVPETATFRLNGGSARLGEIGDQCVVMTYVLAETAPGANVVHLTPANIICDELTYPAAGR